MISELSFARSYTSVWRNLTPKSEFFVRRINLELYDRWEPPLQSTVRADRRALINETAFCMFCSKQTASGGQPSRQLPDAFEKALSRVRGGRSSKKREVAALTSAERDEIEELLQRMSRFFANRVGDLTLEPTFPGSGLIGEATGDVIADDCLYEIKAGDRGFRSIDLRQVIVYLALNQASHSHSMQWIGLFNPRRGVSFVCSCNELAEQVSGLTMRELLNGVIDASTELTVSQ